MSGNQSGAVVDIGTVTTRLLLGHEVTGQLVEEGRELRFTQLGKDRDAQGNIAPAATERLEAVLTEYKRLAGDLPISAFATSALREAPNGKAIAAQVADSTRVPIRIISGEREAELSFKGTLAGFELPPHTCVMVVDVGGGSTELSVGIPAELLMSRSHQVGARVVSDRFLNSDPPTQPQVAEAQAYLKGVFAPFFDRSTFRGSRIEYIYAVAGTATTVVSVKEGMEVYDPTRVHGQVITLEDIQAVFKRLAALPLEERQQVVGLECQRAEVILGGLLTLAAVLESAGADCCIVSETDILQGALKELLCTSYQR
jgi:exopolyphosphatase/guanosine-5'-triphosphate,3'-diphosphate pyrophosphatase